MSKAQSLAEGWKDLQKWLDKKFKANEDDDEEEYNDMNNSKNRACYLLSLSESALKEATIAETISGIWDKGHDKKPRIFRVMPLSWFWAGSITKSQLDQNDDDDDDAGDGGDFGGDGDGGDGGGE